MSNTSRVILSDRSVKITRSLTLSKSQIQEKEKEDEEDDNSGSGVIIASFDIFITILVLTGQFFYVD